MGPCYEPNDPARKLNFVAVAVSPYNLLSPLCLVSPQAMKNDVSKGLSKVVLSSMITQSKAPGLRYRLALFLMAA